MKTFLFLLSLTVSESTFSQKALDVYFLSIGSGHYEQDAKKFRERNFVPYDNLPEAELSASIMARYFSLYTKAKGRTLLSTDKKFVTKASILAGVDSIKTMMDRSKPANPFFVFYYCGHGISENLAWNQFLIPGDYTYVPGNKKVDHLNKHLIWMGDLVEKLDKLRVPYMLLIDCCRKEEGDNSFPEKRMRYFFSDQNVETFKSLVNVLKFMNEFHQPNPVVFSITPGLVAPVVNIPNKQIISDWKLDSSLQVGPICRRALKVVENASGDTPIPLDAFVRLLTSASLDDQSPSSVSFFSDDKKQWGQFAFLTISK